MLIITEQIKGEYNIVLFVKRLTFNLYIDLR